MIITRDSGYRYSLAAVVLLAMAIAGEIAAQQTDPTEGLRQNTPRVHAFTDARVVVEPGRVLENGTLVIRNGIIEAVGADVRVPADARVWPMAGRTLYSGLIDMYSDVGLPDLSEEGENAAQARGATTWNPYLRSFVDVAEIFEIEAADERGEQFRSQGITAVMSVPRNGIIRGQPALVHLRGGPASSRIVRSGLAQSVTFGDGQRREDYPTSAIGAMALIRQSLLDADWYQRAHQAWQADPSLERPETNRALAALTGAVRGDQPLLFEVATDNRLPAVSALTEEFDIELWLRGSGHEYRSLEIVERLAHGGRPLIIPVNFPGAPAVETPEDALFVTLAELRSWHLAPENPARLAGAGIPFALTADGLEEASDFLPSVRRAVERGLDSETALAALTTTPAAFLGIESTHGTLQAGRVANVVVTDGDLFEEDTSVLEVWVDGERFPVAPPNELDPRGRWQMVSAGSSPVLEGEMTIEGAPDELWGTFRMADQEVKLTAVTLADTARRLRVTVPGEAFGADDPALLTASVWGEVLHGWGELPGGETFTWRGERTAPAENLASPSETESRVSTDPDGYAKTHLELPDLRPSMEYGRVGLPEQPELLHVYNATIWTQGEEGVIEDGEMLLREGRIGAVGRNLDVPAGAEILDAGGGHITPGLIDAHLHALFSGGAELGNAIVPEVRIGDFPALESIRMYRQLAGGLTTAHHMHGSPNPIGGQNQIVKLRWGGSFNDLLFDGAPRTVKFALGENPIHEAWGNRYPRTRMGVEQIIRDHFHAALDYRARWEAWERNGHGLPPRRDLRMEALLEILDGEIHIHAHSYRQDEILMLARLTREFGTSVRAFHHAVEAYRVADELAEAGSGAAVWTDWSSYKIEGHDATTYNARLLHDAGVVTSLHSDYPRVARRMHWEAAKLLRTGMDEQDALATVTINTARILGIDDRVGSLEPGKDADFVIWTGHPLSGYTIARQTWVDGRRYFDRDEDRNLRERVRQERDQLIRLARNSQEGREPSQSDADNSMMSWRGHQVNASMAAMRAASGGAQPSGATPVPAPPQQRPIALVGGSIHTVSGDVIEDGILVFKSGIITAIGTDVDTPEGALTLDVTGKHIYPGLVHAYSTIGLREIGSIDATVDLHELGRVNPNVRAEVAFNASSRHIGNARSNGVLVATSVPALPGGPAAWGAPEALITGQAAVMVLDGWTAEEMALKRGAALHVRWPAVGREGGGVHWFRELRGLSTGPANEREYQARIKKLREIFADARAYRDVRAAAARGEGPHHDTDVRWESMIPVLDGDMPVMIYANEVREIQDAVAWAEEEGVHLILVGARDAHYVADHLAEKQIPVLVTWEWPLGEGPLRDWEGYDLGYVLPARLSAAGVPFAIGGEAGSTYTGRLPYQAAAAAAFGLPREEALRAVTLYPAQILGIADRVGSLEVGKDATLLITTGDPLEYATTVEQAFIQGRKIDIRDTNRQFFEKYRERQRQRSEVRQ